MSGDWRGGGRKRERVGEGRKRTERGFKVGKLFSNITAYEMSRYHAELFNGVYTERYVPVISAFST